jgi:2-amino-4-hydroxy-6-hydroxymethyldihydropteridine diphosphokinase
MLILRDEQGISAPGRECRRQDNILQKSSLYETKAWGKTDQPDFLNRAIAIETSLGPAGLMDNLLDIERLMGRTREGSRWSERIIDIDILFFFTGQKGKGIPVVLNDEKLKIPHPYIHQRRFTLEPLNEIAGNMIHPVFNKSISELLNECTDRSEVKKLPFL